MFNPNNPLFAQLFGGFDAFQNNFNQFVQGVQGQGDPKQMVQQLLNSGQMSPQQFENLRQTANQLMGTNK